MSGIHYWERKTLIGDENAFADAEAEVLEEERETEETEENDNVLGDMNEVSAHFGDNSNGVLGADVNNEGTNDECNISGTLNN